MRRNEYRIYDIAGHAANGGKTMSLLVPLLSLSNMSRQPNTVSLYLHYTPHSIPFLGSFSLSLAQPQ